MTFFRLAVEDDSLLPVVSVLLSLLSERLLGATFFFKRGMLLEEFQVWHSRGAWEVLREILLGPLSARGA